MLKALKNLLHNPNKLIQLPQKKKKKTDIFVKYIVEQEELDRRFRLAVYMIDEVQPSNK